jgi:hypothetical protein
MSACLGLVGGAMAAVPVEVFEPGAEPRRWLVAVGVGLGLGGGPWTLEGRPYLPAVLAMPVLLVALELSGVGTLWAWGFVWALSVGVAEYLAPPPLKMPRSPSCLDEG